MTGRKTSMANLPVDGGIAGFDATSGRSATQTGTLEPRCVHGHERTPDRTRASDAERERIVAILRDAVMHGRITVEELDERSAAAYGAVTRGELAALIEDLPQPPPPPPPPPAFPPPAQAARIVSNAPRAHAPAPPPWVKPWPGLRSWMPGMQMFSERWVSPPDPRHAGRIVLDHVVPIFTNVGYKTIHRGDRQLVLQNGLGAIVTIDMAIADGHTETHVWGVAPRSARQALENLSR
jgi:hypothetical protein